MIPSIEEYWNFWWDLFQQLHELEVMVFLHIQIIGNISIDYDSVNLSLAKNRFESLSNVWQSGIFYFPPICKLD